MNQRHIQKILCQQKKVLPLGKVVRLWVPHWPELAVEKIWPEAIKIPQFLDYCPDEWTGTRVDRCYFWGILCTLATEYVTQLVDDCQAQRNENKRLREVPKDNIQPQEAWLDKLLGTDFIPSGRFLRAFFIFALQGTRRASAS